MGEAFFGLWLVGLVATVPVGAQSYPTKPLHLLVPFPAGGGMPAVFAATVKAESAKIIAERKITSD